MIHLKFGKPFRCYSDPLIVGRVEAIILFSEVFFNALLFKIMDFFQLIFCDEKLWRYELKCYTFALLFISLF